MDFVRSPEDNTCVIKILGELDSFVGGPSAQRKRMRPQDTLTQSFKVPTPKDASFQNAERAELIAAKAKIARLEAEIGMEKNERQRLEIEHAKTQSVMKRHSAHQQSELLDMNRSFHQVVSKEEDAREELNELSAQVTRLKAKHIDEQKSWQMDKQKLVLKLEQMEENHVQQMSELKEKFTRQSADKVILKSKLEETERILAQYKSRHAESFAILNDYTDLKFRCDAAEQRVKELNELENRRQESTKLAQNMEKELANYRKLEKENETLRAENKLLRDMRDNALILQEKVSSLSSKLENAQASVVKLHDLECENEKLRANLKKWEVYEVSGRCKSPLEVTRMLAEMQKSNLCLAERQGELETSLSIRDQSLSSVTGKCKDLEESNAKLQAETSKLNEQCRKLQRKLTLVTTDRDGLRRVLASYENEETMLHSRNLLMKEGEQQLTAYKECINHLEDQLAQEKQSGKERELEIRKLQAQLEARSEPGKSQFSISESVEVVAARQKIRDLETKVQTLEESLVAKEKSLFSDFEQQRLDFEHRIRILQSEKESLQGEISILMLKLEKSSIQGEYDPRSTRLLHLGEGPLQTARQKYADERKALEAENEKLKIKVLKLKKKQEALLQEETDCSMNVSRLISTSKPMTALARELERERQSHAREMEGVVKSTQQFREAVLLLCGWDVHVVPNGTVTLASLYAEREGDHLCYKLTKDQLGLVETDFLRQVRKTYEEYMTRDNGVKGDSTPAFLAAVTLELFSQQTRM